LCTTQEKKNLHVNKMELGNNKKTSANYHLRNTSNCNHYNAGSITTFI
jgi:hypothetical protein